MKYLLLACLLPILMAATPDLPGVRPIEKGKIPPGVIPEGLVPKTNQEAAHRVAQLYVDTFLKGKAGPLAKLGTDPFSFDGREVSGAAAIEKEWKKVYKRVGKKLPDSEKMQMEILGYKAVLERFGQAPVKYKNLRLKKCFFAVVQFSKRRGLMLILNKEKKAGWMVTAVTD